MLKDLDASDVRGEIWSSALHSTACGREAIQ